MAEANRVFVRVGGCEWGKGKTEREWGGREGREGGRERERERERERSTATISPEKEWKLQALPDSLPFTSSPTERQGWSLRSVWGERILRQKKTCEQTGKTIARKKKKKKKAEGKSGAVGEEGLGGGGGSGRTLCHFQQVTFHKFPSKASGIHVYAQSCVTACDLLGVRFRALERKCSQLIRTDALVF